MKASIQKVQIGLANFIDTEMVNHLDGWQKIGFGAAAALIIKNLPNTINAYMKHPIVVAFGVIDEDGNIDIDALHDAIMDHFATDGEYINIPMLGRVKITKQDVETLYKFIREA